MKFYSWTSVSRLFPNWKDGAQINRELRLTEAYRAVFLKGHSPTDQDKEIVLADMLANSGFSKVSPSSITSRTLWQIEGMRAMYSTVWKHLTLSDSDVRELENAARFESSQFED